MKAKIALLGGDGIGPEIVDEAEKVLATVAKRFGYCFETTPCLIGGCAIDSLGTPLPDETVRICRESDAVLLGAVGGPRWDSIPPENRPEKGLLGIRKALGLYANLRPVKLLSPLASASPLRADICGAGIDIVIVRELTGGIYFGKKSESDVNGETVASDEMAYSESEIIRLLEVGFGLAAQRRGKICLVDKANVLKTSALWRRLFLSFAKSRPEIQSDIMLVDNAAMQLVRAPSNFDVIVTENMFGDILSDEAAVLTGSIGMIPSASLGKNGFGLYEPIHGSAPDIAGTGKANPLATVLSAAMLLRISLGLEKEADTVENAVLKALDCCRTPDIASDLLPVVTTAQMGDTVCRFISEG